MPDDRPPFPASHADFLLRQAVKCAKKFIPEAPQDEAVDYIVSKVIQDYRYDPSKGFAVSTYVAALIRAACKSWRRFELHAASGEELSETIPFTPDHGVEGVIDTLPDDMARVARLVMDGMTWTEAAKACGIPRRRIPDLRKAIRRIIMHKVNESE